MKFFNCALFFFIGFSVALAQQPDLPKPKVFILTTGGTIASVKDKPLVEGSELVQAVPRLRDFANIQVGEFIRIGSSKMRPDIWLGLAKRIHEIIEAQPGLACVVVTHGTDTMEETAFFLNLVHKHETPVVLVGSMRSSNAVSADGPANLISGVRTGIDPAARNKGVLVVMNNNISAARTLTKVNNNRVDAFPATEKGFLGSVDDVQVSFFQTPINPHTVNTEFNVYDIDSLPKVDIIRDFAGLDENILKYYLERPSDGLVVSSFAGGRTSAAFSGLRELPASHKPVVIASPIRGGRIQGGNPNGTPIITANTLPPNKARILLMLALTRASNARQIQNIFDRY
jgi:L-asparaginase